MIVKLDNLESERKADRCHIQYLEEKVDTLEHQLYSTKLEIKNVPKILEETKEDICEIVKEISKVLKTPIERHDIRDVFRTGKKDAPTILVDFNSAYVKENVIKGARQFNNRHKENKLNTTHLKLDGPAKPVFLSEKLTPNIYSIYHLERNFARENEYKYCWTAFGKVFLRRMDGHKQIHIINEEDLHRLRQEK
ncbi:uncharacterized protein LOC124542638 [Vanessa cardui]|uniref:uncharacterized protein LOC124542638 n=1 Tax=Vanessa cardui TaxID=171605 RepID=UPI001F13E433|nr:uncharacterized protein LOC124542638 [Vanessa cardui]